MLLFLSYNQMLVSLCMVTFPACADTKLILLGDRGTCIV